MEGKLYCSFAVLSLGFFQGGSSIAIFSSKSPSAHGLGLTMWRPRNQRGGSCQNPRVKSPLCKGYGTEGPGMAPVSNRISSKVRVAPVGVLAPICTESARVVNV